MKINEITGALRVSPRMVGNLRDTKSHIIAIIHPEDFLSLTTTPEFLQHIKSSHKPLLQYNKWVKSGEISVHPFLRINLDGSNYGQVSGHEGRHRAAALLDKGGKEMQIGIQFRPSNSYEDILINRARSHRANGGRMVNPEYMLNVQDLPEYFVGQYNSSIIYSTENLKIINPDILKQYR